MLGVLVLNFQTSDVFFIEYNRSAVKQERTTMNAENNDSLKLSYSCSCQHLKCCDAFIYQGELLSIYVAVNFLKCLVVGFFFKNQLCTKSWKKIRMPNISTYFVL